MKKILPLIFFYLTAVSSYCQVTTTDPETNFQTLIGGRYTFKQTVSFADTSQDDDTHLYTFSMFEYTTVVIHSISEDGNYIFFRRDPETTYNIYALKKSDFFFYTKQKFQRFKGAEVGVYTIPFKLRGFDTDDFDFETNLSLLANIVFGFGSQTSETSWFDASVGIGLSSIALSEKNSDVLENRTASALTLSIGGVLKPTSRANIGLFLGGDFLGRSDNNVNWKYDKNLWIGIGVNISFNKVETNKPSDRTTTADIQKVIDGKKDFVKATTGKADKIKSDAIAKADQEKRKALLAIQKNVGITADDKSKALIDVENVRKQAEAEAETTYTINKDIFDAEIEEAQKEIEMLNAAKDRRFW